MKFDSVEFVEQLHRVRPNDELIVVTNDFGDPTRQGNLERTTFELVKGCKDTISRAIFR